MDCSASGQFLVIGCTTKHSHAKSHTIWWDYLLWRSLKRLALRPIMHIQKNDVTLQTQIGRSKEVKHSNMISDTLLEYFILSNQYNINQLRTEDFLTKLNCFPELIKNF